LIDTPLHHILISKSTKIFMKKLTDNLLIYTPNILGLLAFYFSLIKTSSDVSPIHKIIGVSLMLFGFLFWVVSVKYLGGFHSRDIRPKVKLQTKGPYRIVRHPMFFSWIAIAIGAEIFFQSLEAISLLAAFCILLIIRSKREEKYLEKKFGAEWKKYKKKVGFILPKLRH